MSSGYATATTLDDVPGNFFVNVKTIDSLQVSWSNVIGAESYTLYYKNFTANDSTYKKIPNAVSPYTVNDL